MTEYSVEEVRAAASSVNAAWCKSDPLVRAPRCHKAAEMLTAYAERIKADEGAVTDTVVQRAEQAFWPAYNECKRIHEARKDAHATGMRAAILAVWPSPPAQASQVDAATAFVVVDAKGKKFTIYNPDLAKAIRSAAKESSSSLTIDAVCTIPDYGWFCTRGEGHEGPCATWPNAPHTSCPTCGGPATRHEVSGAFEMRDEYRHVPTTEPVAQGEVVSKALEDAWFAVCDALSEIDPDWMMHGPEGVDAAVAKIRSLAAPQPGESNNKPADCSGDPLSCPDNEGRGCYCGDLRRAGESA